ncbi:MAG TPA: alpha-L-rhamnosidase C-terminal domain-containing protein, partial [Puia sp.]|nr:alpha-L-rhamnosidase C-terminal domain-containing protein [Puia sp.]
PSMKAWVDYIRSQAHDDLWNTGFHFGDWLFYHPEDDVDGRAAITDKYLIAQCFYAHSTQLLINAARVLGFANDETSYSDLLNRIKTAFMKEYVTPSGRLVSSTQTAYVLALEFDMLPESLRAQAADRLVENVRSYNNHLTTGFLGTPYLCEVLTRFGHVDVAYQLLLQDTYPSWLYPVKMGATTIWERWDGEKPDSSFQTPGMNSFNHYAYGAIGDFMYRKIAGIDTYDSFPGYKKIRIKPYPGGGFSFVNADLNTYYGGVSSHWKIRGNEFSLDVTIPCNTTAGIYLPAKDPGSITENGSAKVLAAGSVTATEDGYQFFEVPSGQYHFTCNLK